MSDKVYTSSMAYLADNARTPDRVHWMPGPGLIHYESECGMECPIKRAKVVYRIEKASRD